jgi:CheY-like chemotaxis protein
MATNGPIIVVEDDKDDQEIMAEILKQIRPDNDVIFFNSCPDALKYLKTTTDSPFIILSDVNLPVQNGLEFKREIDNDPELRKKSIPFIFLSTSVNQLAVNEAFTKMSTQGFFKKPGTMTEFNQLMNRILDYWGDCRHPNTR